MPVITLETFIHSDIEKCFDLSRSIDLHQISTAATHEKAIAGVMSGLINLNETVTWEATHFGIKQQLSSEITQFNRPFHFRDVQLKGAFKRFTHDHYFEKINDGVLMKDVFDFEAPLSFLGMIANKLFLTSYMAKLLSRRNEVIKLYAETELWQSVLIQPEAG
jgi:ligand-binding SRPBCC domain-containing protein